MDKEGEVSGGGGALAAAAAAGTAAPSPSPPRKKLQLDHTAAAVPSSSSSSGASSPPATASGATATAEKVPVYLEKDLLSQEQLKEITKKLNRDFFESKSAVSVFFQFFICFSLLTSCI